jgi:hypothetical protein
MWISIHIFVACCPQIGMIPTRFHTSNIEKLVRCQPWQISYTAESSQRRFRRMSPLGPRISISRRSGRSRAVQLGLMARLLSQKHIFGGTAPHEHARLPVIPIDRREACPTRRYCSADHLFAIGLCLLLSLPGLKVQTTMLVMVVP